MNHPLVAWTRRHWVAIAVSLAWVALAAVLGPLAGKLGEVQTNDQKSFLPSGAESTQVLDEQVAFASPNTIPAVLVYVRDEGLSRADAAAVAKDVQALSGRPDLDGEIIGPIPSDDGKAVQVIVPLDLGADGFDKVGPIVEELTDVVESGNPDGLTAHVAGPAAQANDFSKAFEGIDTTLLLAAGSVVIVMLLLTYRSPVLWLFPVLSAGIALAVAQAGVYLLARYADLTVNGQSAGILTVLVFGAGTDYALLLVARYREELRRHQDPQAAMKVALRRAGPAVVASGATVIIGLLCLMLAEINSTSGLGPVTAIGIAIGLVVMLSLLPALLVLFGRWVFWPRIPHFGDPEPEGGGIWGRVGRAIAKAPRATWVGTTIVLAAMSFGIVQLDATGLTNEEQFTTEQPSVVGEEALAEHFPGGAGAPVVVIAEADAAEQVREAFAGTSGIVGDSVTEPVVKGGKAYLEGTLEAAPDSSAAFDTIDRVRDSVGAVEGGGALVGGTTAINADVQRLSGEDNRLVIPIILLAVFIILAVLLRAVVAPVVLILTVVLSFGAAVGVSALVFRHLLGFGGADTSFPLFAFVFLVALGIDYNIFLMTRVREEALQIGTRRGALVGLAATGGVITSAGLVLAGTFAVLGTLPIVFLAELGFVVAFGVLLDTIIVRSVLVTAINLDVGRHMWWPSRLGREDGGAHHLADPDHPADATGGEEHAPAHRA